MEIKGRYMLSEAPSDFALRTAKALEEKGYAAAGPEDPVDILILSVREKAEEDGDICTRHDYDALSDVIQKNVMRVIRAAEEAAPRMKESEKKRIVMLTDRNASIRRTKDTDGFAYHMSLAASHMVFRNLFNIYRKEGYTFRCYAEGEEGKGISAADYILRDQSFTPWDPYIHSDENRPVMKDAFLDEIPW